MRKLLLIALLVAGAVVLFVPSVRQRVVGGVCNTVSEWTKPDAGPVKHLHIVKVYIPRGDRYYHLKNCPQIAGRTAVPMQLEKARELYRPCPVCRPPR